MKTQTSIASRVYDLKIPYLSSTVLIWRPRTVQKNWQGISVAIAIALSASFTSINYGGPQLLYALFFGLAFHFLSKDATCQPGIEFCSKILLRTGDSMKVIVLGSGIAGTVLAWLLHKAGHEVTVFDRRPGVTLGRALADIVCGGRPELDFTIVSLSGLARGNPP